MYIPARPSNSNASTLNPQHRRLDLSLVKPPYWSYSNNTESTLPSPPMSDSPTSPRRPSLYPNERSSSSYPPVSSTTQPGQPYPSPRGPDEGHMLATPPIAQHYGHLPSGYLAQEQRTELHPRPIAAYSPYPPHHFEGYLQPGPQPLPVVPSSRTPIPGVATFQGPTSTGSTAPRVQGRTRRTKAHVAKACQNCKKAHLSCDEVRPCGRCVASGKQSTCVDVEHKKRGRPRLRDERDPRLEQQAAAQVAAQQAASQPPRPIRSHRRGDSFRALQSQAYGSGSDESRPTTSQSMHTGPYTRVSVGSAEHASYHRPSGSPGLPVAMAFLNLNLQVLKSSDALRILLTGGQDLTERPLTEFVMSHQEGVIQRVQNELRDERNRLEPTLLPSIFPEEADRAAVRDRDPEEADLLSREFLDRQEVLTFRTASGHAEQFQARIRLARTSSFFATMILYRMQPPPPSLAASPYARGPQYSFGDASSPMRPQYGASNPPSPFSSLPGALMTTLPPPPSFPASYAYSSSTRPDTGYFARSPQFGMHPPPLPAYSPAEQRLVTTPGQHRPSGTVGTVQLPPIVSSAPTTPLTGQFFESGMPVTAGSVSKARSPEQTATDTSDEEQRKRRRLNIKDIVEH